MPLDVKDRLRVAFSGRLLLLGFGTIGQGILPLLFAHIEMPRTRISILAADAGGRDYAEAEGLGPDEIVSILVDDVPTFNARNEYDEVSRRILRL